MIELGEGYPKVARALQVDLRTSAIEPLHARWTIGSFTEISGDNNHVLISWKKPEILDLL
jgi:hypothetical protein